MQPDDVKRHLLRHTLATLSYRAGKAVRGAPEGFATFRASEATRTPVEVLAHVGDLLGWALSLAKGEENWPGAEPAPWGDEVERCFTQLVRLDEYLASDGEMKAPVEKLFQGPIADALTHVGQIAMLRGMAGAKIRGENYFRAEIETGRVGAEQAKPVREFD